MARNPALSIVLLVAGLTAAVPASGQTVPDQPWSHGTTLGLFGGTAIASDAQATLGATLGWELNRRFEIEGIGAWVVPADGSKAYAAELRLLTNLTGPHLVTPFVAGGAGMYLATFDAGAPLPPFYQNRLAGSGDHGSLSFTDPSLIAATGVDVFVGDHFSFRPEVSVRLLMRSSETYAVTMVTVRATYHFERHQIVR
jgi:hypothetical protein